MPMTLFRMTLLSCALCVALTAPAAAPANRGAAVTASGAAPTALASACPTTIRLGGRRYAYYQRGRVNCRRARDAVRRLWETYGRRGRPRGYRCGSDTRFRRNGICRKTRTTYFGYNNR